MRSLPPNPKDGSAITNENTSSTLQDIQRLAEIGRLSASLLHEISNPLTSALLYLEQYKDHSSAGAKKALKSIKALSRYVDAAKQQIRQESRVRDFKLAAQVTQIKQIVLPLANQSNIQLRLNCAPDIRLYGDPVKFQQILANLIVNAIEAYEFDNYSRLDKHVDVAFKMRSRILHIKVTDWGKGINPLEINRIFDIYYSTKSQSGHGMGMGLAIVNDYVVNDFCGSVVVRSSARVGTIFTVKIPIKT